MLAGELVNMAARLLNDEGNVRWPRTALMQHLAEAQRRIALTRPDAVSRITVFALAPGSQQTIPDDGFRVLDVLRNMGPDGATPGSPVRFARRQWLDDFSPDWRTDQSAASIDEWTYDAHSPRRFSVHPAAPDSGTLYVELVYAVSPAAPAAEDEAIALDGVYAGPLLDFMLYRALATDAESRSAETRAQAHYQAFFQTLGVDMNAAQQHAPSAQGVKS